MLRDDDEQENLDKIFEAELKRRLDRQTFDDAFYAKRDEYIDFRTSLWVSFLLDLLIRKCMREDD